MSSIDDVIQEFKEALANVYIIGSSSVLKSNASVAPKDIDVILIKDTSRVSFRYVVGCR